MSESMRMQSQLTADLEVYRAKGELIALRAENARLRKAMQSAYDYITNHRHGKAKAMLFDGLELYRQAALQPKEATWHAK